MNVIMEKNGQIIEKSIVQMIPMGENYYDREYIEVDAVDLPIVGKKYFVWTGRYVGPNRDHDEYLRWSNDDEHNKFLIENGMGGNSNHEIKRFHGWRGTTDDNSVSAEGVRTCLAAQRREYQKTVHYKIVFGDDEAADKD